MAYDSIRDGMLEWEYTNFAHSSIFRTGIPIYKNKFMRSLQKKDGIEIPIHIKGDIVAKLPTNLMHILVTLNFCKENVIYKYLKNYKKLIENFFIYNTRLYYYNTDQFPEKYFIGRGILTDDNGNILCLVTRNYIKCEDFEGSTSYIFNNFTDSRDSLTFYISPKLIANPKNAFEKAFIKNIYNNVLTWNSIKVVIDSDINSLFLLDKCHIGSRMRLQTILDNVAESSERIIDSLEDYSHE
jgi:hypothetical protein